jgi:hypothetical protein
LPGEWGQFGDSLRSYGTGHGLTSQI